ncbi:MAG: cob(I)yrinic acid a,c-diamide adenosyltransferase [Porticoccaceae bacterium]
MTRIYTRSGDQGDTGLANGSRVRKDSLRIEAIGTVDECNTQVGLLLSHLSDSDELRPILEQVQHRLLDVGATLAAAPSTLSHADVELLEKQIDKVDAKLSPLKQFILPGGNAAAATAHVARAVCRRAERCVLALGAATVNNEDELPSEVLCYLNRLSDLLFTVARALAARDGDDVAWIPGS